MPKVFTRRYQTVQHSALPRDILLVFVSRSFIHLTAGAAMSNHFTNPRNDSELTYTLGSDIQITWETDFDRVSLRIYHFKRTDIDYMLASNLLRKSYICEIHTASKLHQRAVTTSQTTIATIGLLGKSQTQMAPLLLKSNQIYRTSSFSFLGHIETW